MEIDERRERLWNVLTQEWRSTRELKELAAIRPADGHALGILEAWARDGVILFRREENHADGHLWRLP